MPTNIRIIHTHDFLRAKPDGILDLATSCDLLKDLATESNTAGKYLLLVDTRRGQCPPLHLGQHRTWFGRRSGTSPRRQEDCPPGSP